MAFIEIAKQRYLNTDHIVEITFGAISDFDPPSKSAAVAANVVLTQGALELKGESVEI